ncbi:MAG: host attachment protein [Roseibium sp.]|nr:host attachment protein [Roseibium sp.]
MAGLMISHKAWVLVGDGEKALIFRNTGSRIRPRFEVVDQLKTTNPKTSDQGTSVPGRRSDGPGPHSSAMDETDWHKLEKHRFASDIAERLYKAAHAGKFAELVVVAPPLILGDLRAKFHKEVKSRIVAEVDKTLTNHPPSRIEHILTKPA